MFLKIKNESSYKNVLDCDILNKSFRGCCKFCAPYSEEIAL